LDNPLKIKIEHEIARIDKLLDDMEPLISLCKTREPDIIEITAAAQVLHSFYNGVESIIVLFFKYFNEQLPNDFKWHKTLFDMIFGNNVRNIEIIRADLKKKLEKYLLFRHFIRHSYGSELEWAEMDLLIQEIDEIWKVIKVDFKKCLESN
jgi:hypothetical protein